MSKYSFIKKKKHYFYYSLYIFIKVVATIINQMDAFFITNTYI